MLRVYILNCCFVQSSYYFFRIYVCRVHLMGLQLKTIWWKLKLQGLEQQYKLMNGMLFSFLASPVTYLMFLWWRAKENSDHHCAIQANTHNLFMHEVSWRWMMTYRFLIVNLYHMFMFFPSWLYDFWML